MKLELQNNDMLNKMSEEILRNELIKRNTRYFYTNEEELYVLLGYCKKDFFKYLSHYEALLQEEQMPFGITGEFIEMFYELRYDLYEMAISEINEHSNFEIKHVYMADGKELTESETVYYQNTCIQIRKSIRFTFKYLESNEQDFLFEEELKSVLLKTKGWSKIEECIKVSWNSNEKITPPDLDMDNCKIQINETLEEYASTFQQEDFRNHFKNYGLSVPYESFSMFLDSLWIGE